MQEAVKGQFWRLRDSQGKPPGVIGWWPSRAVTFIDNHGTGSTQVPKDVIFITVTMKTDVIMNCPFCDTYYILAHPGTVIYDHFCDWSVSIHDQIVKIAC